MQSGTFHTIDLNLHPKLNGVTPEVAKQVFLVCLQDYYKSSVDYPYSADPAETKIFISDAFLDSKYTNLKPAIMVFQTGCTYRGAFRNDDMQLIYQTDPETGEFTYKPNGVPQPAWLKSALVPGAISITVRARGAAAVKIASEVFIFLKVYIDIIRALGIFDISGVSMGRETPIQSDVVEPLTEVSINVDYTMQVTWTIAPTQFDDMGKRVTAVINGALSNLCSVVVDPDPPAGT